MKDRIWKVALRCEQSSFPVVELRVGPGPGPGCRAATAAAVAAATAAAAAVAAAAAARSAAARYGCVLCCWISIFSTVMSGFIAVASCGLRTSLPIDILEMSLKKLKVCFNLSLQKEQSYHSIKDYVIEDGPSMFSGKPIAYIQSNTSQGVQGSRPAICRPVSIKLQRTRCGG
ncbi:jg17185 [Pararge aegeria aegeria]|uniref:Jg17185 protein n=1 Tax=Pararge aegeria aegeria TaxID=348720 RepID=A0A8S4SJF8_9NEOP|nr:jg17185 [Pararge aegeria aegeria]